MASERGPAPLALGPWLWTWLRLTRWGWEAAPGPQARLHLGLSFPRAQGAVAPPCPSGAVGLIPRAQLSGPSAQVFTNVRRTRLPSHLGCNVTELTVAQTLPASAWGALSRLLCPCAPSPGIPGSLSSLLRPLPPSLLRLRAGSGQVLGSPFPGPDPGAGGGSEGPRSPHSGAGAGAPGSSSLRPSLLTAHA